MDLPLVYNVTCLCYLNIQQLKLNYLNFHFCSQPFGYTWMSASSIYCLLCIEWCRIKQIREGKIIYAIGFSIVCLFLFRQCVENVSRSNCPVCLEDIHTSRIPCHIPECGHLLHRTCFEELFHAGHYACPTCQTSLIDMSQVCWQWLLNYEMNDKNEVSICEYFENLLFGVNIFSVSVLNEVCVWYEDLGGSDWRVLLSRLWLRVVW